MPEHCYRVNAPAVIFERFDDELVAINLDTGVYHSLIGSAADAFQLLNEEATAGELAEALARKYAAGPDQIAPALGEFLKQLETEGLVNIVEVRKARGPLNLSVQESGVPFAPPTLEAYRDLQSLFLLDPVHEVGEQGWPQPATNAS